MARVRIDPPEKIVFSTPIDVRLRDINTAQHMGNEAFLVAASEARARFIRKLGYVETDIEGTRLIMADSAIIYKSEVFYGQILNVEIGVSGFWECGCEFIYRMTIQDSGKLAALAKNGWVFLEKDARVKARVPEKFKARFL